MKIRRKYSQVKHYQPLKKFMLNSRKKEWLKKAVSFFTWFLLFEISKDLKKIHSKNANKIAEFAWEGFIVSACMILLLSPGIASFVGITFPIVTIDPLVAQSLFVGLWISVVFSGALVFTGLFFLPKFPRWIGSLINRISIKRNNGSLTKTIETPTATLLFTLIKD